MYSLVFFIDDNFFVKTLDMGLSLLYLNFLSSMIIDFNSLLPLFGISAKPLLNRLSIYIFHHIIVYIYIYCL